MNASKVSGRMPLKQISYNRSIMQVNSDGKYINVINQVSDVMNLIVSYEELGGCPRLMTLALDEWR
jgi:hypothetical protein